MSQRIGKGLNGKAPWVAERLTQDVSHLKGEASHDYWMFESIGKLSDRALANRLCSAGPDYCKNCESPCAFGREALLRGLTYASVQSKKKNAFIRQKEAERKEARRTAT